VHHAAIDELRRTKRRVVNVCQLRNSAEHSDHDIIAKIIEAETYSAVFSRIQYLPT
jgi:hypothetical protein